MCFSWAPKSRLSLAPPSMSVGLRQLPVASGTWHSTTHKARYYPQLKFSFYILDIKKNMVSGLWQFNFNSFAATQSIEPVFLFGAGGSTAVLGSMTWEM